MGKTDHSELLTTADLEQTFRSKYPRATDQEIASLMAAFLEEVPGQAVLDDGGLTRADAVEEGWREAVAEWIRQLKKFAGDAYPPRPRV